MLSKIRSSSISWVAVSAVVGLTMIFGVLHWNTTDGNAKFLDEANQQADDSHIVQTAR